MTWAAELKRRNWYCINSVDMPNVFKKYLYDQWYGSLSDEDKQYLEEQKKKRKEQEDRELQDTLRAFRMMTALYSSIAHKYWVQMHIMLKK